MNKLYTAHAHMQGGRDGRATAQPEGRLDVPIKPPPDLGGPKDRPDASNPEELFALGYGACFLSALTFVAGRRKIRAREFTIDSVVHLLGEDDGSFAIGVELHGNMPGIDDEQAAEMMRDAHKGCPYSKATRGNIEVKLFVGDAEVSD